MSSRHEICSENLTWREVDEEIVILDLESSKYFSLNGTGALLWKALDTGAEDSQLPAVLVDRFGLSEEVASADVIAFLDHCVALGIVREHGALDRP